MNYKNKYFIYKIIFSHLNKENINQINNHDINI